ENSAKDIYRLHIHPSLEKTSKAAASILKKNFNSFDAFWVHLKEFDDAGHDGRLEDKKRMIETADKHFFSAIRNLDAVIVVTSDHATPCSRKAHSGDKVPLIVSGISDGKDKKFSEQDFAEGSLETIKGYELLKSITEMIE
ncbi:MAG: hypothetical protein QMD85_04800, partial [Candidatus Aenigmarchaeota archaeon]|nr:hypothetical protein [Candidatus Aenigmarchaeota archaeon]